jgi:hypothetical protein
MVEMIDSFQRISNSLKIGGVIYCSFKFGDGEHEKEGRVFTNMHNDSFDELMKEVISLEMITSWTSFDVRPGREDEKWFNAILKKISD